MLELCWPWQHSFPCSAYDIVCPCRSHRIPNPGQDYCTVDHDSCSYTQFACLKTVHVALPAAQHTLLDRQICDQWFRVEYALDAILSHSRAEHEVVGNKAICEHDELLEESAALPFCENDTDYNMVKKLLCNDGFEPNGPYGVMLDDFADADSDADDDTESTPNSDDYDQDNSDQDKDEFPDRGAWLDEAVSSMSHPLFQ